MIEKIELQWLISFQSVYEHLSFKQAAQQLELPTSNVSRHVALLEQQLNSRLLQRTTRKMTATAAGKQLYHSISALIQGMDEALEASAVQGSSLSGPLKIILPDLPFMADIIADFSVQYPAIQLSCDTQLNPTQGLIDGFDLVLCFARGPLEDSGWVAREILRWPSSVVAAPELLKKYPLPLSLEQMTQVPCITGLSVLKGMPWRFKQNKSIQVQSSYKVNSANLAKAAALKGLGFAILANNLCQADINRGALVKVDLDFEAQDLVLYAYYAAKHYPLRKVTVFLQHLRSKLKEKA